MLSCWRVIAVGLLIASALSCASSTGTKRQITTADGAVVTTYDDARHGIRLTYPGDWEEVDFMRPKGTVLLLAPPNKGGLGKLPPAVAVVAPEPSGDGSPTTSEDLDSMQQKTLEKAQKEIADFKLVETSSATVGGEPARQIVYTGKKLGQSLQVMYLLTTHAGRPYALSYMSAPETFDDHRGAVERMVHSVQWMK